LGLATAKRHAKLILTMKSPLFVATLSLASLVHVLCCFVPALSLAAGAAGLLAMLDWLQPLRLPLLGCQFLMLAYAGYKAFFSRHAGHRAELVVFWLSVLITLGSLAYPYWQHRANEAEMKASFGQKLFKKIQ
jgi:hypothetical protein